MDRNTNRAGKQGNIEAKKQAVKDFVKEVNSTLANEPKAVFLIPGIDSEGLLYSRYGKGTDDSMSASHLFREKKYLIADPEVANGTKSAEKGTYYLYSEFTDTTNVSPAPEHKAVKASFADVLDFVNNDDNSIRKPAKPKLGFWERIRNAFSFALGKPEKQKKYEREMDVYIAKKMELVEKNYDFKVPGYKKELLNSAVASEYIERDKVLPAREATQNVHAKNILMELTKEQVGYIKKGADYINAALNSDDPNLSAINRGLREYLIKNTHGKVHDDFIKNLVGICEKIGMQKEQMDLGYIDDNAMKEAYFNILDTNGVKQVNAPEPVKAEKAPEQKKVENVKEELIKEEPEKAEPEKNSVKEKPLNVEELKEKGAFITIKRFIDGGTPEIASGAKAISDFMESNPDADETKVLEDFLSKGGMVMRQNPDSAEAKYYKQMFQDACAFTNEKVGGDPESMPEFIRNMNIKGAIGTAIPSNYEKEAAEAGKKIEEFNKQPVKSEQQPMSFNK